MSTDQQLDPGFASWDVGNARVAGGAAATHLDPLVSSRLAGDHVVGIHSSGATTEIRFGVPLPGILRMRIGPAPARTSTVSGASDDEATLEEHEGCVLIRGVGVEARWDLEGHGFSFGPLRRAATVGDMRRPVLRPGRILRDDTLLGWLEAIHLDPDAAVYGSGECSQGLDLRGRRRTLINRETHGLAGFDTAYINVPWLWSDAGWGVLAATGGLLEADIGATYSEAALLRSLGPTADLFVMCGDAIELLRSYHALTGSPGPFPEWGFGVWMSRASYMTAKEIEDQLDELESAACPVDVVHVDAWQEGNVFRDFACNWAVDRGRFPPGWSKRLAERSVHLSMWFNPFITKESPMGRDLAERGFLVRRDDGSLAGTRNRPGRALVDFTSSDAVRWWQEHVRAMALEEGAEAFKLDFGEDIPLDGRFSDGRLGSELANEYALLYHAATHEALAELVDAPALFCRSGTTGSQRYPCHWVGDSPSTWDGLVTALRSSLSLSLSGLSLVSHDIGGFWSPGLITLPADSLDGDAAATFAAEVDPELYARWAQWGALSPIMRFHGLGRREPTAYPEPYRSAAITACRLRKSLQSYLVAHAEAELPLMRPMAVAYPGDRAARAAELQYLLGPDILVAPVLEPGGRHRLWVPPGCWEPLWGLEPVEGPGWIEVDCGTDTFPAFVDADAPWPLSGHADGPG